METKFWNDEYRRTAEITLDGDNSPVIRVYQSYKSFSRLVLRPPEINWSAIGSTTPEVATAFVGALSVAIDIAREWNRDTGRKCAEVLATEKA